LKTAVLEEPNKFSIIKTEVPEPGENEIVYKLEGCGICGSNLPVWEGREWFNYPLSAGAPGHEGWGIIHKTGSKVNDLKEGDKITALSFNAFAEYDTASADAVIKLPEGFTFFPGEPLGCIMNIFKRSNIKEGDFVAVIGIGFIGALLVELAKKTGACVIAISRRDYSLETAKKYGADYTIPLNDHWEIVNRVKEITDGNMCSKVIEAVGKQWPLDLAGDITAEGGRLIIAGYHQESPRQVNMQMWNWKGIDVINAHERKTEKYMEGIKEAVEAVQTGVLNPIPLYTTYFFDDINNAFNDFEKRPGGFIKGLLLFN
jgi:threonine dehydrogenase-like Zn-dependent dehydrogenase